MATRTTWLIIGAAIVVAGSTPEAQRHDAQVAVHEIADSAVVGAIHCASDLDEMTVHGPGSAWSAVQADTSPYRPPRSPPMIAGLSGAAGARRSRAASRPCSTPGRPWRGFGALWPLVLALERGRCRSACPLALPGPVPGSGCCAGHGASVRSRRTRNSVLPARRRWRTGRMTSRIAWRVFWVLLRRHDDPDGRVGRPAAWRDPPIRVGTPHPYFRSRRHLPGRPDSHDPVDAHGTNAHPLSKPFAKWGRGEICRDRAA
jgi:hypothetical protein